MNNLIRQSNSVLRKLDGDLAIKLIIGANIAVYAQWQVSIFTAERGNLRYLRFMQNNFTSSYKSLTSGKIWTTITSAFSHSDLFHLGFNMFMLWSFGPVMASYLSVRSFLNLYVMSGISGSLVSAINAKIQAERIRNYDPWGLAAIQRESSMSLGASGSLMGLLSTYCLAFPRSTIYLFVFPVPAFILLPAYLAYDYFSISSSKGRTDHAGHLGGAMYGIGYYYIKMRSRNFY